MKGLRWILAVGLVAVLAGCGGGGEGGEDGLKIVVIPKGTSNPFWKSVHAGAAHAEKELGNVEDDISAAETSGWAMSQDFMSPSTGNFSKTGRSRSLLISPHGQD